MDTIELRGLTFYGYHGAFAEEQRLGQRFVVDLRLGLDLAPAGQHDDLGKTVDYGKVAGTVRAIVEGPPFRLIEALAEALAAAILAGHAPVERVEVRVAKPSAPVVTAPSGLIAVEITRRREGEPGRVSVGEAVGSPERTPARGPDTPGVPRAAPGSHAALHEGGTAQAGLAGEKHAPDTGGPVGSVLSAHGIRNLLAGKPPLLDPLDSPDEQVQPNGVDLTLESVWRMDGVGAIGVSNSDRVIPAREPVPTTDAGWFELSPGTYVIRFREVVSLPLDVMAFGRPRSSLLRCGAAIHTAVWDAGYSGRSEALLVVYAGGVRLAPGARVLQLVFVRLEEATHAYTGAYQGENLTGA